MPLLWGRRKTTGVKQDAGQRQKNVDFHFRNAVSTWDEIYHQRSALGVIMQERQAVVLTWIRELGLPLNERILEVGCGAGLTTVALAEGGYPVVAVDSVLDMLGRTLEHAAEADVRHRITTVASDIQHLCFSSGCFGAVLAIGVIPYIYSPHGAIAEMARVLCSGGYLILTAHNLWGLNELLDPATFFDPRKGRPFAPVRRAVKTLLLRAGWRGPARAEAWAHPHSMRDVDRWLSSVRLEKVRSMTIGFGPFTCFNHLFLPRSVGIKLHHRFQNLADRNVPGFRSTGHEYMVLARKLTE
jgi:ubiquinone/menaquinone biosynthesis C-methylase UbiE